MERKHLTDEDVALVERLVAAKKRLCDAERADTYARVRDSVARAEPVPRPGWFPAYGMPAREAMKEVHQASQRKADA